MSNYGCMTQNYLSYKHVIQYKFKTSRPKVKKLYMLACLDITGAMWMAPAGAAATLCERQPLHLQLEDSMRSFYTIVQ